MCATCENANINRLGAEASEVPATQSHLAETDLIQRLQEGPETAYREFVERYQADVYRVAYGIIGRRNKADEVAQEVFAKAYFFIKRFDGHSSLYAWVYRMAVNECYGFLRRKRRGAVDSDDSASPGAVGIGSRRDFLNKLLDSIPEENRYLLLLRELEGYSVSHLVVATGLNENTIKMKLLWTRQALAKSARRYRCTS
jgi:RNA polymerase sigma-70 factor, ECF subfamily